MSMSAKERLLAVLRGQPADRIPYSPMLTYWWEAQGKEIHKLGEIGFLKSIRADPLIRGHYPINGSDYKDLFLFDISYKDCEIKQFVRGNDKVVDYVTSKGSLRLGYKYIPEADTWFLVNHPVRTADHFELLSYLMDQIVLTPNEQRFEKQIKEAGEDALVVPLLCPESKSSFQSLVEKWVGTEQIVYSLMDEPQAVEQALAAMGRVSVQAAEIAASSAAPVFMTWEDSSTTNISPSYYEQFVLPEINAWCDILHKQDKLYIQHACGHLKALLPLIAGSKIDCIESVTPIPTGNVKMEEVVQQLPKNICIMGGIDPVFLQNCTLGELEAEVRHLLAITKNRPFVLANSDSCPPGVSIEKFSLMGELVR